MSVPVDKRTQGKLTVCVEAQQLAKYTLSITTNKKIFTEQYQHALTDAINTAALEIYLNIWAANNVYVNLKDELQRADALRVRREYQARAYANCQKLLALIDLAKPVFHLTTKRVIFWADKTIKVKNLLRAWKDSDNKRFK